MLIANPIYDTVFKRLMENERAARFFIGTLLNQHVTSVKMMPQEFTHVSEADKLTVFRLDFMATIKTADGRKQKVLIEMQKAKKEIDLMRFRGYLGEQYKKAEKEGGTETVLPITTIYILGFKLPEIPTACIRVGRTYHDLINDVPLTKKSPFVEKLTHDSYVVQVGKITKRYQTRLDKLLSLFEQVNFIDDTEAVKQYEHKPDDADVKVITDILHHAGTDPEARKELDREIEARRTIEDYFGEQYAIIAKQNEQLKKQEAALAKKDVTLAKQKDALARERTEKKAALAKKEAALAEKEAAFARERAEKEALLAELAALKGIKQ
jgi:hypothetical protein